MHGARGRRRRPASRRLAVRLQFLTLLTTRAESFEKFFPPPQPYVEKRPIGLLQGYVAGLESTPVGQPGETAREFSRQAAGESPRRRRAPDFKPRPRWFDQWAYTRA